MNYILFIILSISSTCLFYQDILSCQFHNYRGKEKKRRKGNDKKRSKEVLKPRKEKLKKWERDLDAHNTVGVPAGAMRDKLQRLEKKITGYLQDQEEPVDFGMNQPCCMWLVGEKVSYITQGKTSYRRIIPKCTSKGCAILREHFPEEDPKEYCSYERNKTKLELLDNRQ